jgi:hypothetical protein
MATKTVSAPNQINAETTAKDIGTTTLEFLETGKSLMEDKGLPVFVDDGDGACVVKNSRLHILGNVDFDGFSRYPDPSVLEVIVPNPRSTGFIYLCNGDEDEGGCYEGREVTVSYRCLARLMFPSIKIDGLISKTIRNKVYKAFDDRSLRVLDFTLDATKKLTPAQSAKIKGKSLKVARTLLSPPEAGYTLVENNQRAWHRPASVLFVYEEGKRTEYWLIGMDEGSYFGVVLPEQCETIKDAFTALIPKAIRGKNLQRQGEWFAVPVTIKSLPDPKDCAYMIQSEDRLVLPKDNPDSNDHTLDCYEGRIARDGTIYVKSWEVEHPEHQSIQGDEWVMFVRNAALRSVSVEGVD